MTRTIDSTEFPDVINGLVDQIENDPFTFALEQCREPIAQGFVEIFANKEDSGGSPWPEHSPVTTAIYGPHPLLRLSDDMYQSMIGGGQHHVEEITERELSWGTSVVYAFAQNYGFAQIPAREFAYFTDSAADGCMDVLSNFIDAVMLAPITRG